MKTTVIKTVSISMISPNPNQPRKFFDEYELKKLSDSIRENGILQPLTVRKTLSGYELISGERRLRAAIMAGLKKVPCIIMGADAVSSAIYSIIENIQREDLTFFEEARAISVLINEYGISRCDAAAKLGIANSTLSNKLRLLSLPEKEQKRIAAAGLTERHARALLKLPEEKREAALDRIIAGELCVKDAEKYIDSVLNPEKAEQKRVLKSSVGDVRLFSNSLTHLVQTLINSGISARQETKECKDYIEYKIKIPKPHASQNQIQLKIC